MLGHGRPIYIVALALVGLFSTTARAIDWKYALRPMQEDAELADICMIDHERGWAVGDRGVIWYTSDGGRKWQLQESGVTCRLSSVHFIDPQTGWAAGGTSHPYTHTSVGVVLHTRDGGKSWRQEKTSLPAIRQIRFFNAQQGWAIGDTSAIFPTGVFTTDSGGRTWTPLVGLAVHGWLAGDFIDPTTGATVGRSGTLAAIRRRALETTRTPNLGLRGLHRLKLAPPTGGWLVGDGGLVLTTPDLGTSWQLPAGNPAVAAGSEFDWRALDQRGPNCWIAGAPGTRVLHTADGGQTWQAYPTGQSLPIHAISFVDDQRGWAVGALGTILTTNDGGKHWQRQRAGGTRVAILALLSEPNTAPLEFFTRLSANEGYLSTVEFVNRRDIEPGRPHDETLPDRAHAALVAAGASAADTHWAFPLRQSGLGQPVEQLVDGWDRANDGQGVDRLLAHLVRQIRQWRPEVVVTQGTSQRGEDPLGYVISQLVLRATEQAADATRFPEHAAQLGLEPWKVKKVLGSLPDGRLGAMNITTSQLAPRFGCSLAELADAPRGWLANRYAAGPSALGFQLLIDAVPQGAGAHDFMSGITLSPGSEARRFLSDVPDQGVDLMRRVAQKNRNLQAIIAHTSKTPQESARFLAQIGDLTNGLDEAAGGELLFELAQHYARNGHWEMAAETFQVLTTKYPNHTLAPATTLWLMRFWSSGEVAWQLKRKAKASSAQTVTQVAGVELSPPLGQVLPASGTLAANLQMNRQQTLMKESPGGPDRLEQAAALAKRLEHTDGAIFAEPTIQFPLAVVLRNRGLPKMAEKFYLNFSRSRPRDAWWSCAAGELWLNEPKNEPPKSIWRAAKCDAKPRLDGQLDEPLWDRAESVKLASAQRDDADWPATAQMAYDDEFLYLALTCRQPPTVQSPTTTGPRPHDPDLSSQDRVELLLDIDRDYGTYYRLVVDQRGWVAEDCWGDKSWNPQWFVAAQRDEHTWTIEAAIPLDELTGERPQSRHVWALGLQRTLPAVGFQSWTVPSSTAVLPEGFGYLIFE